MARIVAAESDEDYRVARTLIDEYVESLDFVLDFQDYESERLHLPEHYGSPGGRLLLAFEGTHAVGCVALFGQSESACEMKRLYVRPQHRGTGIGRQLAVEIIRAARELGYRRMKLDTTPQMEEALGLYRSLGFRETAPYRPNPVPGASFWELALESGEST